MIDDRDLCFAMRSAVERRRKERKPDPLNLETKTEKEEDGIYELFSSTDPRFERLPGGQGALIDRPVDIRFRSRWRMNRLLNRRAGTAWREWNIQTLIDWILDNWETIVKVLLTLIMVII